jgi:hypothetical protein
LDFIVGKGHQQLDSKKYYHSQGGWVEISERGPGAVLLYPAILVAKLQVPDRAKTGSKGRICALIPQTRKMPV